MMLITEPSLRPQIIAFLNIFNKEYDFEQHSSGFLNYKKMKKEVTCILVFLTKCQF